MTYSACDSSSPPDRQSTILRGVLQKIWSISDGAARKLVAAALVFMLGSSIAAALSPLLLKVLVDTLDSERSHDIGVKPLYLVLAYALMHLLSRSLAELRGKALGTADQRVNRQLSDEYFRHIMSLPLLFHLKRRTGALGQTLTNGLIGYRIVMLHLVNSVLPILVELAGMGTVLVFLGHGVFLVIIGVSVLLYALAFWTGAVRVREPAQNASVAHINASAVFTDSLLNCETVKCFNGEAQMRRRFGTALKDLENCWKEIYERKMQNGFAVAVIFTLSLGSSVFVAVGAVKGGTMGIGDFVLVNAYVIQLVIPIERIGFAFRDIAQGVSFIEKMTELAREQPEPRGPVNRTTVPAGGSELEFKNVSFGYKNGRDVLRDVCFVVPPGHTLGVVGTSGSGKSSLIRLLLRLLKPDSGQIYLGGIDLFDIPIAKLRSSIAVVPQDPVLFDESIAFNISFARPDSSPGGIVAAARIAGIHDFILRLPEGYGTRVGERGIRLSGGEKQRLAIARALVRNPDIYIFDEATSALDSTTERQVLGQVFDSIKNVTTIIMAHRLSTVVHADEIVVFDEGEIIERGTHERLLQSRGLYAAMWLNQQAGGPRAHFGPVVAK